MVFYPQQDISTHTLTWSVTGSFCSFLSVPCHFNSHAHVERDTCMAVCFVCLANFNSHAHVERDDVVLCVGKVEKISTHTLTWSVTDDIIDVDANEEISTHTLTWSVTDMAKHYSYHRRISTHTLTWSVTNRHTEQHSCGAFQLTRSRGA